MNKQHTPGPWSYSLAGRVCAFVSHNTPDDIADVAENDFGQFKANIHLIAAAPDLLAALAGMLECGPGYGCEVAAGECCHHVSAARAAIAKARGQE